MNKTAIATLILSITLGVNACAMTTAATKFNGSTAPHGEPAAYQKTTVIGLHLLMFVYPLIGDGELVNGVNEFTRAAKKRGPRSQITQTETTVYWYLPVIGFFLTPVVTEVYGYVYKK